MVLIERTIAETLKAIASGRQEITSDVLKAIDLGLAKKAESAFAAGSRLVLTPEGLALALRH